LSGLSISLKGDNNNSAVIFLHGFMGSGHDWDEIISSLSDKYYCITIDLPGHGQSNNLEQLGDVWSFDAISRKLSDILIHLEIKTASLLGYSMGGRIALYFALKYPQLISRLILESTSPGIKNDDQREARLLKDLKIAHELRTESFDIFLDKWYELPFFSGIKIHPKYPSLINRRNKNNPHLLAQSLESFSPGKQAYLMDQLVTLKMRVNLICGEKDQKYLNLMNQIKQQKPPFNLKIFNDCGHNVHFEKSEQFAEHLLRVLSL